MTSNQTVLSPKEVRLQNRIKVLTRLVGEITIQLHKAVQEEEEARAERLALGKCQHGLCVRPATGRYGAKLTCDLCRSELNDEFDEEYR